VFGKGANRVDVFDRAGSEAKVMEPWRILIKDLVCFICGRFSD
jgi:hypothetical protein